MAVTPMMRQYLDIKAQHEDSILFFRLGDFYEMFYDDAKLVSRELDLTLTGKDCGEPERAPMCGIPYHSADGYIGRLISRGYKVVICEQTEDPAQAKGLVRREVVRVVTPGTVIDNGMLDESRNNYLCAVYISPEIGVAFADVSTGDISATVLKGQNAMQRLYTELGTFSPREILLSVSEDDPAYSLLNDFIKDRLRAVVNDYAEHFDYEKARQLIERRFDKTDGENEPAVRAVGALLAYIAETQYTDESYIKNLTFYTEGQFLEMDINTRRNLELSETMLRKEKKGSLLSVLDRTKTSMGARLIRKWTEQPLMNVRAILNRQDAVAELYDDFLLREELSNLLGGIPDLERLMTKVIYGTAGGKDLHAVLQTLKQIPEIKAHLADCSGAELLLIYNTLDPMDDVTDLLSRAITDDPPFSIREGGIIHRGYNAEVDELYDIIHNGKSYIDKIEAEEREKTGIRGLKIGYNRVFGYYIEITKSNLSDAPEHYIRKQTLTNAERFITQELKDMESTILGATDKVTALEYELFCEIRDSVADQAGRIQKTAGMIAALDVYVSLADIAVKNNYTRPDVEYGDTISIKDGRHPVVEQFVTDGYFVPNDTTLDTNHNRLMLITGPNMAGKSTYMRQVALIVIMAQIGSFVPAREASIGVVDRIFTRVGASDDLASGQSTFMLEMTEVAYILKNATKRSLIIYDEIGRGTSTFDGMSIARATAEYTLSKKIGAKTLFATHYHELTSLEGEIEGVVNYNIAAKKKGDKITFLRKIVRGAADESYGIEVALLAGVPGEVIKRAKELLRNLEIKSAKITAAEPAEEAENQNITFDDYKTDDIIKRLNNIDPELLTPIESLNLLYELKKAAQ
ncbi:MAG: DNA mismatch repair protein MutS [Eubacteriales bacterium]|jgi:DNA mismatch repair protein MutS|nr:DNA mismatch repair protein MutS [Eubacteriales bacterium]